jgi:hypothetical protein
MAPRIQVIDNTKLKPTPIFEIVDKRGPDGLKPATRRKLDARKRRRAKREAKELGARMFVEVSEGTRKRIVDLVAIMRDAATRQDSRAERQIFRALVDGLVAEARKDR